MEKVILAKVAVILVMYRQKHNLQLLYSSLTQQSCNDFKIYFVDNNPDNSDTKFSEELNKSFGLNIDYFPAGKNTGFAGGNNLGAGAALKDGCRYLFFLNNDTILHESCIEELLKPFETNNKVGASAPLIFYWNGKEVPGKIQEFGAAADFRSYKITKYFEGKEFAEVEKEIPENKIVDLLPGAATIVRSEVLKQTGLWEEMYFAYGDEIDLAKRIKESGYRSAAVKKAMIWHNHKWNKVNKTGYYFEYYLIQRNKYLYFCKFGLWGQLLFSFIIDLVKFPVKLIWFIKICNFKLGFYYIRGTFAGIFGKKGKPAFNFIG